MFLILDSQNFSSTKVPKGNKKLDKSHNIFKFYEIESSSRRAVVVAQLVKQSLPSPEVRSSNPVIYSINLYTINCIKKTKIKNKSCREWPIL